MPRSGSYPLFETRNVCASSENLVKEPCLAGIEDVKAVVTRNLLNALYIFLNNFGVDVASLTMESYTHKILALHDIACPLLAGAGVKFYVLNVVEFI